jgi:hypothetical protein
MKVVEVKLIYDLQSFGLDAGIPAAFHHYIYFISLTIAGFLIRGTLSDERMGL